MEKEYLKQIPLFAELEEEELARLAELVSPRRVRRGETLFWEDEPGESLYLIRNGLIKIFRLTEEGREKTLALLAAGDFFGEMALLDAQPRSATTQALADSELLVLHKRDFQRLLLAHPEIALKFLAHLSRRLRDANAQIEELAFAGVQRRVARALLTLGERYGEKVEGGRIKITVKLTQQELANLAGVARETATRVLCELQDAGVLNIDERHWVFQPERLREGV